MLHDSFAVFEPNRLIDHTGGHVVSVAPNAGAQDPTKAGLSSVIFVIRRGDELRWPPQSSTDCEFDWITLNSGDYQPHREIPMQG